MPEAARSLDRRLHPPGLAFGRWAAPDGWSLRRFAWPAEQPRGSLLFLGGRGDFVEKYIEALAHWHDRGWDLAGFDWRGQGGSGRLHGDPLVCHLESFDPLLDDLEAFVRDWIATSPVPHVVVAHSMGGHLLLRVLADRGAAIDAAVLLAPMVGIASGRVPLGALRLVSAGAVGIGLGGRRLWRRDPGNVGGRLTACPDRQADKLWWKANHPEIASGAPSWRWLNAATRSLAALSRADVGRIGTRILILSAERDAIVDVGAIGDLAARLPTATLRLFSGTGHELLREADETRLPVLAAIDDFLPGPG